MTDCNEAVRPVHNHMPVLLHPDKHDRWLHGSIDDVIAFQFRCFPDELIEIERTSEPWIKRGPGHASPCADLMISEWELWACAQQVLTAHKHHAAAYVAELTRIYLPLRLSA